MIFKNYLKINEGKFIVILLNFSTNHSNKVLLNNIFDYIIIYLVMFLKYLGITYFQERKYKLIFIFIVDLFL